MIQRTQDMAIVMMAVGAFAPREQAKPMFPAACRSYGLNRGTLVALADSKAVMAAAQAQKYGKRPNILVIWGDDIGYLL